MYICYVCILKIGAKNSSQQRLVQRILSKDYSNQWTVSLCSFPTMNPGLLSVAQKFNRNRRVQPYPAEFTALHLWKQHSDKRICISKSEGIPPRVSEKLSFSFLWYKRNSECCIHYSNKGQQTCPTSCEYKPTQGGLISLLNKASVPWEMEKETFSVQDWWLGPAGISHCHRLRTSLWSSESEF